MNTRDPCDESGVDPVAMDLFSAEGARPVLGAQEHLLHEVELHMQMSRSHDHAAQLHREAAELLRLNDPASAGIASRSARDATSAAHAGCLLLAARSGSAD
jgi:hypothetical protein